MFVRVVIPSTLYAVTLVLGVWTAVLGRPYNGALFNVHKLVALGAVIFAAIQVVRVLRTADAHAVAVVLLIAAAVCVIALFASGALLSSAGSNRGQLTLLLTIHRVGSLMLTVGFCVGIYLLLRNNL